MFDMSSLQQCLIPRARSPRAPSSGAFSARCRPRATFGRAALGRQQDTDRLRVPRRAWRVTRACGACDALQQAGLEPRPSRRCLRGLLPVNGTLRLRAADTNELVLFVDVEVSIVGR